MSALRDAADYRDKKLRRAFENQTSELRVSLEDWIIGEVRLLMPRLQMIVETTKKRQIRSTAQSYIEMLRELHTHRISDIVSGYNARLEDVHEGFHIEPLMCVTTYAMVWLCLNPQRAPYFDCVIGSTA